MKACSERHQMQDEIVDSGPNCELDIILSHLRENTAMVADEKRLPTLLNSATYWVPVIPQPVGEEINRSSGELRFLTVRDKNKACFISAFTDAQLISCFECEYQLSMVRVSGFQLWSLMTNVSHAFDGVAINPSNLYCSFFIDQYVCRQLAGLNVTH